jgi:hypothetical protein
MELNWDNFATVKQKFINDIIKELDNLELPPEWSPRDVLGFVIRKIEDKGKKI